MYGTIRAAKRGHSKVIRLLLRNGANVMVPEDLLSKSYSAPLTREVSLPRAEILDVIRVIDKAVAEERDALTETEA